MDNICDCSFVVDSATADSNLKIPKALLRRSPRFDDSDTAVIYEDLGITDHVPNDGSNSTGTPNIDHESHHD